MTLKKYEVERKLGEIIQKNKILSETLDGKKAILQEIRTDIQQTTKEKQIKKKEEDAARVEQELNEVFREMQQIEIELNALKAEQANTIIYPVCPNCQNRGNIFVFQGTDLDETIDINQLSETLPTTGTGIIYCIKCGHIIGTAYRDK